MKNNNNVTLKDEMETAALESNKANLIKHVTDTLDNDIINNIQESIIKLVGSELLGKLSEVPVKLYTTIYNFDSDPPAVDILTSNLKLPETITELKDTMKLNASIWDKEVKKIPAMITILYPIALNVDDEKESIALILSIPLLKQPVSSAYIVKQTDDIITELTPCTSEIITGYATTMSIILSAFFSEYVKISTEKAKTNISKIIQSKLKVVK